MLSCELINFALYIKVSRDGKHIWKRIMKAIFLFNTQLNTII